MNMICQGKNKHATQAMIRISSQDKVADENINNNDNELHAIEI